MSINHSGNVQPSIDNEEHEHSIAPATKRVLSYGWDGAAKQILRTDDTGQLMISGTISGGVTTVYQGGSWDIRSLNSTATLYAVVNTGAVGNTNALATLLAGPNQIGSVTISNYADIGKATVNINNELTALATVNVSNIINSLATANISNVINSIVTIAPRTDYIGLASVSGNVVNLAGTAQMGSVTISNMQPLVAGTATIGIVTANVNLLAGSNNIGDVDVASIAAGNNNIGDVDIASLPALAVGTATIGIVRLTPLIAGTAQIGSVTVSNPILAGTAQIGSVTVSSIGPGTATIGIVRIGSAIPAGTAFIGLATTVNGTSTAWMGLATVAVGAGVAQMGSVTVSNPIIAGTAQIGSVTVSSIGPGTAQMGSVTVSSLGVGTATIGIARVAEFAKTFQNYPVALNATNLSGSTIFIAAASVKFHITNLMLSCASVVGISILSGATYLVGNASIRMQFAAQSGIVNTGSVGGPVLHALADASNFLIATDTAAPIAGSVSWYEE